VVAFWRPQQCWWRDLLRRKSAKGTLIRHASVGGFGSAVAVVPLTIPVVGFALGALLVSAVGFPSLPSSGFLAATITAITMTTITTRTDVERDPTIPTLPLAKKDCASVSAHPHPIAGWTSDPFS
jgi:hypothetical protein